MVHYDRHDIRFDEVNDFVKHLRVLEKARLVERTISGRVHRCALNAAPLRNADEWLDYYERFWEETLDSLSAYLHKETDLGPGAK